MFLFCPQLRRTSELPRRKVWRRGVPTIVSEEVALSGDIRRYDAGVVVKRDARQLVAAISDLLSNKEKAAALAANGRRLVEERYSPEGVGKALEDLYEEIAMNHPSF